MNNGLHMFKQFGCASQQASSAAKQRECRQIYCYEHIINKQQQNGNSTGYIKTKWEKELNIEISEEDWHSMLSAQHSSTSSRKWRIFAWKNLIRFFITPHIENKLSQSQGQCWRRCGHSNADHSHIFWSCLLPRGLQGSIVAPYAYG